ncbi:alkanesulfonate monooxygenase [bacterium SCGC AG-212-C10]|nr:alkanesulfonate monooxygenase [bacterium SCGC AG-212-C10]
MSLELVGLISGKTRPDVRWTPGTTQLDPIDPDFVVRFARAHEEGDFDAVLIGYGSTATDGFSVGAWAAAHTDKLRYLIAHRPGFVSPTVEARKVIALDNFSKGRIHLNIVTGGNDEDLQRDGDFLTKDDRYRRTDEYLDVLKLALTSAQPFDYAGQFYRVNGGFSDEKPYQQPYPAIYFGGASGPAIETGAKHADTYMMWGEPLADVKQRITEFHAVAAKYGRKPKISVSFRPIIASTEAKAWERAYGILDRILATRKAAGLGEPAWPQNTGSQRLLQAAADGDIRDKRLFTGIARANGAAGNSTALVGTPDQVAEAILEYYDIGVETVLIRGFDPLPDAIEYGRDLVPAVRAEVKKRERELAIA